MVVIATNPIEKGTVFGPIPKTMTLTDPAVLIGYRTCDTLLDIHTVKLDLTKHIHGTSLGEWVPYVQSARNSEEQNLEAYSEKEKMFYVACKHVPANCEVFVWYEEQYARLFGVPQLEDSYIKNNLYNCPNCEDSFIYPNCLRAHMKFKCKNQGSLKSSPSKGQEKSHSPQFLFQNDISFSPFQDSYKSSCKRKLTEQENHESNSKNPCSYQVKSHSEQTHNVFEKCPAIEMDEATKSSIGSGQERSTSITPIPDDHVTLMHQHALMFFQNFQPHLRNPLSSLEMVNFLNNSSAFTIINSPTIFVNQHSSLISKYQSHLLAPYHSEIPLRGHEATFQRDPLFQSRKISPHSFVESQLSPAVPSTFAALNLSQNWCAKCNTSFRMTSDLVYHMRSHHKRDFDPVKKRKDDKLKCEVCGESFRERHHLTRHMTSHV